MSNTKMCKTDCIDEFIEIVKYEEGIQDWIFELSAIPSLCDIHEKRINIRDGIVGRPLWEVKEEVLHEVAHIFTQKDGNKHSEVFYKEYIRLLNKYMIGE